MKPDKDLNLDGIYRLAVWHVSHPRPNYPADHPCFLCGGDTADTQVLSLIGNMRVERWHISCAGRDKVRSLIMVATLAGDVDVIVNIPL